MTTLVGTCQADAWGVKSMNVVGAEDEPPSVLFHITDDWNVEVVDTIRVEDVDILVDAIAMDTSTQILYGYELIYDEQEPYPEDRWTSRLVRIDTQTAEATHIGDQILDCEMRGATFTPTGKLCVIDARNSYLFEIDPGDGSIIDDLELYHGMVPFALITNDIDLTPSTLGLMVVIENDFFELTLDESQGRAILDQLHADTDNGTDGQIISLAGLAQDISHPAVLVAYDIHGTDEIFVYTSAESFVRSFIAGDIVNSSQAGSGDLARGRPVVEPAPCIDFETYPDDGGIPQEGDEVSDQWDSPPWNVRFHVESETGPPPLISAVGEPMTAFTGPLLENCCADGITTADMPAADQDVGCLFITDDDDFYVAKPLTILYSVPVQGLTFDILDIDGIEAWKIEAFNSYGQTLKKIWKVYGEPGTGNGIATPVEIFSPNGVPDIMKVVITFDGGGPSVGLAFDNFCPSVDETDVTIQPLIDNGTPFEVFGLAHLLDGYVDPPAMIRTDLLPLVDISHTWDLLHTLCSWSGNIIPPDHPVMGCYKSKKKKNSILGSKWTDEYGRFVADAAPGHEIGLDAVWESPIWKLGFTIKNTWVEWTGAGYPPAPGDGPGASRGPITVSDLSWAISDRQRAFEELTADLYTDPSLTWQPLTGFTLAHGDSVTTVVAPPEGFYRDDVVILGYTLAGEDLEIAQFVQAPLRGLLPDLTAAPEIDHPAGTPMMAHLIGAIPNPFNPSTTIRYDLPREGMVDIGVYSLSGRHVATLKHEITPAGTHEVTWRGRDDEGKQVASGVYICRLEDEEVSDSLKIVLLK